MRKSDVRTISVITSRALFGAVLNYRFMSVVGTCSPAGGRGVNKNLVSKHAALYKLCEFPYSYDGKGYIAKEHIDEMKKAVKALPSKCWISVVE